MKTLIINNKQIEFVRHQYLGTPLWMIGPGGNPSKLTEEQWLAVRTADFKAQYGDWESAWKKQALEALTPIEAPEISIVPEYFICKARTTEILHNQIAWAYSKLTNRTPDSPVGKVSITKKGIRDSLFKGINKYKASLYPILDCLIKNSIMLYTNIDADNNRQFILGSKYVRNNEKNYVGIVIKIDSRGNKYYSHTIYQKNNRKAQGVPGNQGLTQKLHPAINTILQDIFNVNLKRISIPIDSMTNEPILK